MTTDPQTTLKWNDHYLSNEGRGPTHARVMYAEGRYVWMERWHKSMKRTVKFKLPINRLLNNQTGWRPA